MKRTGTIIECSPRNNDYLTKRSLSRKRECAGAEKAQDIPMAEIQQLNNHNSIDIDSCDNKDSEICSHPSKDTIATPDILIHSSDELSCIGTEVSKEKETTNLNSEIRLESELSS